MAYNTQDENAPENAATMVINAETTTVSSTGSELVAFSNGQMEVNGNLYVTAETNAIDMRGYSTMTINESGENTVVLDGNIAFETPGVSASSGTVLAATLSLTNEDSSWTGNTYVAYPSGDEFTEASGFHLTLSNGATWNVTDVSDAYTDETAASVVKKLAVTDLTADGGVINLTEGGTAAISGSALETGGLTVNVENAGGSLEYSSITGSGGLAKTGDGTLILAAYTGATAIEEGVLRLEAAGATLGTSGVSVESGALLELAFDGTYASSIAGEGGLTADAGAGNTVTLTGENTYTGTTTIESGTLAGAIAEGTDLAIASGAVHDGSGADRTVGELTGEGTISNTAALTVAGGDFSGSSDATNGSLVKTGDGTLTLSGTNAYTGVTTVEAGTLNVGSSTLAFTELTLVSGATFASSAAQSFSTLNVDAAQGGTATYDGNLSVTGGALTFISTVSPDDPLLTVTGDADVSGSTLSIGVYGGTELAEGTTMTLLTAGGTLTAEGLAEGTTAGEIRIGSTIAQAISVTLGRDGSSITGVSSEAKARDGSKALSESWLSGLALTTQGADLVANGGMAAALEAVGAGQGFGAFVAMGGSILRYETGSSVHMEDFPMMAGAAASRTFSAGRGTLGAFLEYGYGSYDTYNAFNGAGLHGEGDSHYCGLGLMGRMDFSESPAGHAYVEASARAGA